MRTLAALCTAICLSTAWADAPAIPASAPVAVSKAAAAASDTAQLGEIHVRGLKPMVEVLQQMKTAIDAPFSNDPKHYDDMVCRIEDNSGYTAQGAMLDCGTQGWFNMQRGILHRDMDVAADPRLASSPTLGHPWHIVRLLNHEQLAALRSVLAKLPLPGKGEVQIVDDSNHPAN
ncbi:MAG TPA: hypothetical protein VGN70_11040 [Gammaproteobacteria bacterium]|jgi:hypothetical protein